MMVPTLARTCIALALAALIAAFPFASSAQTQPIEIPVILPLTGSSAFSGNAQVKGLAVFEAAVNKWGGIAGRPVKFNVLDDTSTPAVDVQLMNRIIAQRAPIVLGPASAGNVAAVMPLLKEAGPVSICFSPTIRPEEGSYVFSPFASSLDNAIVTARFAKQRAWKKIAFLVTTDASGVLGEQDLVQAFNSDAKDTKIVDIEHYGVTDLSVAAQIAKIKAAAPDAVFVYAVGSPASTAIKALAESGVTVPIGTTWANSVTAQLNSFKSYMPKELFIPGPPSMVPPDQLPRGKLRDQVAAYYREFVAGGIPHPDALMGMTWDAASLVVSAYRRLGPSATAAQFREYLASLRGFTGVSGTYDFKEIPQRGLGWKSSVLVARWDASRDELVSASGLGGN